MQKGRASAAERVLQGALVVLLAAALGLGCLLAPSETGTGTHSSVGLPECGMLKVTGRPCPTCGVTTSFVLAAHGRFAEALENQPFGVVVFALVVALLAFALVTAVTGRSWYPLFVRFNLGLVILCLLILLLISWAYKWYLLDPARGPSQKAARLSASVVSDG